MAFQAETAQILAMSDPILNTALSGLTAANQRLAAAASNIANAQDTGPLAPQPGQTPPYQPSDTVQSTRPGGGTVATYRPVTPASQAIYDPNSPFADGNGLVAAPNVDTAQQLVQAIIAKEAYAANAKVVEAAQSQQRATLDLFT
ncbi:MAG: flagellar basal body rod protein FlgC [Stellaceae bacterium]